MTHRINCLLKLRVTQEVYLCDQTVDLFFFFNFVLELFIWSAVFAKFKGVRRLPRRTLTISWRRFVVGAISIVFFSDCFFFLLQVNYTNRIFASIFWSRSPLCTSTSFFKNQVQRKTRSTWVPCFNSRHIVKSRCINLFRVIKTIPAYLLYIYISKKKRRKKKKENRW